MRLCWCMPAVQMLMNLNRLVVQNNRSTTISPGDQWQCWSNFLYVKWRKYHSSHNRGKRALHICCWHRKLRKQCIVFRVLGGTVLDHTVKDANNYYKDIDVSLTAPGVPTVTVIGKTEEHWKVPVTEQLRFDASGGTGPPIPTNVGAFVSSPLFEMWSGSNTRWCQGKWSLLRL